MHRELLVIETRLMLRVYDRCNAGLVDSTTMDVESATVVSVSGCGLQPNAFNSGSGTNAGQLKKGY